jgi:hypothetical protein
MSYGKSVHNRPERKFTPTAVPQGASSVEQSIPNKGGRAALIAKHNNKGADAMSLTLGEKT